MKRKKYNIYNTILLITFIVIFVLLMGYFIINSNQNQNNNQDEVNYEETVRFKLNGQKEIIINTGDKFKDPGFKAESNISGDISSYVQIKGNVNTKVPNTYKIEYIISYKGVNAKRTRTVIVKDKEDLVTESDVKTKITPSKESYTNESIDLNIEVTSNKFSHIKLPNGQIVTTNKHNYKVSKNGKYSFEIFTIDKVGKTYTYEVKNIDKEKPTGTCQITQNAKEVFLTINAKDNIGVKNYVYNNNTYTTNKISIPETTTQATVVIYDEANNQTQITCKSKNPVISKISKDGVIITVEAQKSTTDISGYYFSYTNKLPDKNTGGYIATNREKIDLVRLAGTTYVWVEDKNGMISTPKTVTIDNSALLLTRDSKYKKLEKTSLEKYLKDKGWSIEELNKLIIRSSRAAGLYSQEAAATSAVALQTVLAQKYNLKLPYWWGGKSWDIGANKTWGTYKETYSEEYDNYYYYYGLDCSGFTTWSYVNAGYDIKKGQYPSFWSNTKQLTKDNGEIGDFMVQTGHVTIIVGKTNEGYIKAEAAGKGPGMVLTLHPYTKTSGYYITKGSYISSKYPKMDKASFPSGF